MMTSSKENIKTSEKQVRSIFDIAKSNLPEFPSWNEAEDYIFQLEAEVKDIKKQINFTDPGSKENYKRWRSKAETSITIKESQIKILRKKFRDNAPVNIRDRDVSYEECLEDLEFSQLLLDKVEEMTTELKNQFSLYSEEDIDVKSLIEAILEIHEIVRSDDEDDDSEDIDSSERY